VHGLGHRINRASAAFWVFAPIRDEAPTKWLWGALARLVILSDHEQLLARSAVASTGKVVEPVISHFETVDDREVHRASGLYDAPAQAAKVVIDCLVVKLWQRWPPIRSTSGAGLHCVFRSMRVGNESARLVGEMRSPVLGH
jgi:hypothetical protein